MKDKLYEYLERFMIQNNWLDEHISDRARAIFTTICLTGNIDADDNACGMMLCKLYDKSAMEEICEYEEFENFMIALIV